MSNPAVYYQCPDCDCQLAFGKDEVLSVMWKRDRKCSGKTRGTQGKKKQTIQHKNQSQTEDKGERERGEVNGGSHKELCDAESSDLMFSIVSSGMGATVCTAGRFLLVAPLTNEEDEEEEEEAESVAPRGRVMNL